MGINLARAAQVLLPGIPDGLTQMRQN